MRNFLHHPPSRRRIGTLNNLIKLGQPEASHKFFVRLWRCDGRSIPLNLYVRFTLNRFALSFGHLKLLFVPRTLAARTPTPSEFLRSAVDADARLQRGL